MMRINGEPVEKVTSFESLRAGDLIWHLDCRRCGRRHRGMLTETNDEFVVHHDDSIHDDGIVWRFLPGRSCKPTMHSCITREQISTGVIYRVVLDLSAPAETTHEKRRERVE